MTDNAERALEILERRQHTLYEDFSLIVSEIACALDEAERRAAAAEREGCANLAEVTPILYENVPTKNADIVEWVDGKARKTIATAIRARD